MKQGCMKAIAGYDLVLHYNPDDAVASNGTVLYNLDRYVNAILVYD